MATNRPPSGEYARDGGIISDHPDHQAALDGLVDRQAVKEQAMISRSAGRNDESVVKETWVPGVGIDIQVTPYSEEAARAKLQERH
jgi:hypothetical protein